MPQYSKILTGKPHQQSGIKYQVYPQSSIWQLSLHCSHIVNEVLIAALSAATWTDSILQCKIPQHYSITLIQLHIFACALDSSPRDIIFDSVNRLTVKESFLSW